MDEAMMFKLLKSLNDEINDETMLVLLERPVKRGRKLDWDELEYKPEKITVHTSTDLINLGVLKLSADYKVPMGREAGGAHRNMVGVCVLHRA